MNRRQAYNILWLLLGTFLVVATFRLGIVAVRRGAIDLSPKPNPVIAAQSGDLQKLISLESNGMSLNFQYPHMWNWTPLIAAIESRNTNVIQYLLKKHVALNLRDRDGRTALIWAIRERDTNTIKALVVKGADREIKDSMGASAAEYAAAISDTNIRYVATKLLKR
ncbi:MAG TPA: ankyrin repeat domain-containing protein [Verrucomicrobiae bacterium]|jgi:ankyrin repeat protein|nr:ankyrin repeat domain-containing protein [Verrucomicrobiae bacterium]